MYIKNADYVITAFLVNTLQATYRTDVNNSKACTAGVDVVIGA